MVANGMKMSLTVHVHVHVAIINYYDQRTLRSTDNYKSIDLYLCTRAC